MFWSVEPARDPRAITVLFSEIVLALMELPLRELAATVLMLMEFPLRELTATVLMLMEFPLREFALTELTDAVLSVNMFVQYIALFAPLVKTWFWGTKDDNDMIYKGEK